MKFERVLTNDEEQILKHDLVDVIAWINAAIDGKINNCKKRAAIQCRELLKKEGAAMVPANDEVAARALFSRPDYKTRTERDEAEKNSL